MAGALETLLARLARLRDDWRDQSRPRPGGGENFRCVACEGCSGCRFCSECDGCDECNYCELCIECSSCTQCRACAGCHQTSHSSYSADCSECSYTTLCIDCDRCVQCFACVGLQDEEFCFLNERLPRKEFFAKVAELRAELDARAAQGWLPDWVVREGDPAPTIAAAPEPVAVPRAPVVAKIEPAVVRGVPVAATAHSITRARRPDDERPRPPAGAEATPARPSATVRAARRPERP
jgi:hypothetical protein